MWRIYIDDEESKRKKKKKKVSFEISHSTYIHDLFISIVIITDSFFNESKKQLNIEFLTSHFSLLNENPLTVFTFWTSRKARTLRYAIVRRVVACCFFFFPIPFFSHVSIPFHHFPLSFHLLHCRNIVDHRRFKSEVRIVERYVPKFSNSQTN